MSSPSRRRPAPSGSTAGTPRLRVSSNPIRHSSIVHSEIGHRNADFLCDERRQRMLSSEDLWRSDRNSNSVGASNAETELYQIDRPCRQNRPSPKPSERNRQLERKSSGRSACAVSRFRRETARNLAFFGAAHIGGEGFEGGRLERAKGFEPSTPTLARLCSGQRSRTCFPPTARRTRLIRLDFPRRQSDVGSSGARAKGGRLPFHPAGQNLRRGRAGDRAIVPRPAPGTPQ